MKRALLDQLIQARAEKRAAVTATELGTGEQRLIDLADADDPLAEDAKAALADDQSRIIERRDQRWFVQPYNPALKMLIVGAVHVTQPLAKMAAELAYAVTVIDPRKAFVREERFAGVDKTDEWPDEALRRIGLDHRTAVILLSHDPKLDDPALNVALDSNAFYIGALGSKKTHEKRVERLTAAGISAEKIARIRAPIGLDIGAKTPAEIAASIVAEVTQTLRGKRR
jgi:xanthine dehydrogenase accessory factor